MNTTLGGRLAILIVAAACVAESSTKANGPLQHLRRWTNLSGFFSSNAVTPYERILMTQPVFAVTTPYGSPYMSMEKISDADDEILSSSDNNNIESARNDKTATSISEEQNEYRTVCLYFLDPDDALALHDEMKQLDNSNMAQADLRITSTSLGKAWRQASYTGHGSITGAPVDPLTGTLKKQDGAILRYKIVPPKRQLYYAARCRNSHRVGLWSSSADAASSSSSDNVNAQDAMAACMGNSALEAMSLMLRRDIRERKGPPKQQFANLDQAKYQHMQGHFGVPVFYCPFMHKKVNLAKRLALLPFGGMSKQTIPLFCNYEDLQQSWMQMKQKDNKLMTELPDEPPSVEVFNLWDVVTSMDRQQQRIKRTWHTPLTKYLPKPVTAPQLDDITLIPSSRSVEYKEQISARGNGKARLRPMR